VHPKTRNNATTSARRAVGSLDVLRSYRNPCFKHVSWTSLYRFQRSEIREKKSVTLEIQNCFEKKREKTCSEEEEKLKNARQRDRFGGGFIPAFREIQDHLMCVCIVTCSRARKEDGRKALLLLNIKCVLSVVFFVLLPEKKQNPALSYAQRKETSTTKPWQQITRKKKKSRTRRYAFRERYI